MLGFALRSDPKEWESMSETIVQASAGRYVGQAVLRKEDPRLLTGRGRYTDDVTLPGMLHAHFVRSDVARAKIRVDVSAAREADGVVAVFTGADLNHEVAGSMYPSMFIGAEDFMSPMYPLAVDRTVVDCDWLYLSEVVESGRDLSRSVELFHRVNEQDFAACERCQPAMASRSYAGGGVLVPSEHHIGEFHDWVRTRLE